MHGSDALRLARLWLRCVRVIMIPDDLILVIPPHQGAPFQLRWMCFLPAKTGAVGHQAGLTSDLILPSREAFVPIQRERFDLQIVEIRKTVVE